MIKGFLAALSIGFVFLAGAAIAQAAPPANDVFAQALPLAAGQEISSANVDATAEAGEPNPAGGARVSGCTAIGEAPECATSVWYAFEPPATGQYTIETCDLGTEIDSILGVYTGAAVDSAVEVASNDDACVGGYSGNASRVTFTATEGTVYHVDVTGYSGDQGSFYLRAYAGAPQPRPEPDTGITRSGSYAQAITEGSGAGVVSGPRHSASFILTSGAAGATFECSLDGSAFAACASPVSFDGLTPGSSHIFKARAISGGTPDPTPVVDRFTIDLTPPETTLTGPVGNTAGNEADWNTTSNERNPSNNGFRCRLDGQPTETCGAHSQFTSLCQGTHTFSSSAWDLAANLESNPPSAQINVTSGPTCAAPTLTALTPGTIKPTWAEIKFLFENTDAGATLRIDYGPTAAYGMKLKDRSLDPGVSGQSAPKLRYLTPGTLYHYRVTISTPSETVSTPDQTLTTSALTGTLPTVQVGAPSASMHAARIPLTIDPNGLNTSYFMWIAADGPATSNSAVITGPSQIPGSASGPQAGRLEVVDLDPSTTYHYRVGAEHSGSDSNEVLGPEGSFTTPPAEPPANDEFAGAAPLGDGQEISSSNLEATAEAGEPNPAGAAKVSDCGEIDEASRCASSVWYAFEPPATGQYTIETCDLGTELNSVLGVYIGSSVGSAVEIAANDDESSLVFCPGGYYGQGSRVTFAATEGTVYHVDVTGRNGEQGSFYLRSYAGSSPQPRPEPDTGIARLQNSFAYATATGGAGGGVTSGPRHSASFVLESEPGDATFECSLDDSAFAACTSPVSYNSLAPGSSHIFKARAISGGTPDPTPAVERFTIDLTPPDTTLTSGPEGDTPGPEAEWTTAGNERNQYFESRGFLCRLDGQPAQLCEAATQFTPLCQGAHTFSSSAWDRAANVDPTPATAQINVTSGPPCAPPTLGEPTTTTVEPTRAEISFSVQNTGGGSTLHVDYGPTAAYGMSLEDRSLDPGVAGNMFATLRFLTPGTLYHYRVTISSPFGTASSGDHTVTTGPLTGAETLPTVEVGTPSASEHAALIPVTIDTGGVYTNYFVRIAAGGPVTSASGFIPGRTEIEEGLWGPQSGRLEVVDLDPSTTYHFRIGAEHGGSDSNEVLGPEGTFTTPPIPPPSESTPPASTPSDSVPAAPPKPHFRLRKGAIAIGKLERNSKRLLVAVRDLPAGTVTRLELKAGRGHLNAHKAAPAGGLVKFDIKLSAKVREALLDEKVKTVVFHIVVSPPGDTRSEVTLTRKLRPSY